MIIFTDIYLKEFSEKYIKYLNTYLYSVDKLLLSSQFVRLLILVNHRTTSVLVVPNI